MRKYKREGKVWTNKKEEWRWGNIKGKLGYAKIKKEDR
jgi:hypothetical protein